MQGEALLIGIGTFAIGIAGFSAVAASLGRESRHWGPTHSLRVRAIVSTSFNVAFESVVPLIAASALGDAHAAVLIASLLTGTYGLVVVALRTPQFVRAGGMRQRSMQAMFAMGYLSVALYFLNGLIFVSIGVYALGLCFQLLVAAVSFYTLIAETT